MQNFRYRNARQGGQALVEMVVTGLFFLVPLFLAVVAMGKFIDVQHTTNMGARYAAWERTVWYEAGGAFDGINAPNQKSAAQIHAELTARLFNDRTRKTVIANSDKNAHSFVNGIDPLWRDNANVAYMRRYDQAGSGIARGALNRDVAGKALGLIGALPLPKGVTGSLVPPLPSDTFSTATVSLREIARDSQAYQRLWPRSSVWVDEWRGLDFRATGAILSNTWGANSSRGTHDMVAQSVPTAQGLGKEVGRILELGIRTWDNDVMKDNKLELGKIAPDVVPEDRLK
jgi:hypothetical protein